MASGKLGSADLAAAVDTILYTVPAGQVATVTVSYCARTASAAVRLAVSTAAAPAAADYLEFDAALPVGGVLERSGVVLSAGERVIARASVSGVSVRVHGFEEAA